VSDEGKLHDESNRGARAAALLSDPMFQEAFSVSERRLIDKWIAAPVRDRDGHHELLLMVKALRMAHQHVATVATTGRLANLELEQRRKRATKGV
jgi:hypothetical protein